VNPFNPKELVLVLEAARGYDFQVYIGEPADILKGKCKILDFERLRDGGTTTINGRDQKGNAFTIYNPFGGQLKFNDKPMQEFNYFPEQKFIPKEQPPKKIEKENPIPKVERPPMKEQAKPANLKDVPSIDDAVAALTPFVGKDRYVLIHYSSVKEGDRVTVVKLKEVEKSKFQHNEFTVAFEEVLSAEKAQDIIKQAKANPAAALSKLPAKIGSYQSRGHLYMSQGEGFYDSFRAVYPLSEKEMPTDKNKEGKPGAEKGDGLGAEANSIWGEAWYFAELSLPALVLFAFLPVLVEFPKFVPLWIAILSIGYTLWQTNHHTAVKTPRAKQRWVQHIGSVGSGKHYDVLPLFEPIHFYQNLVECLFAFIMTTTHTTAASATNGVNFIHKYYARCIFLCLRKQVTHA
jgi:hypothetical protein